MPKNAGRIVVAMTEMLIIDSHRLTIMMWLRLESSCMCQTSLPGSLMFDVGAMAGHWCCVVRLGRRRERLGEAIAPRSRAQRSRPASQHPPPATSHHHPLIAPPLRGSAPRVVEVLLRLEQRPLERAALALVRLEHVGDL